MSIQYDSAVIESFFGTPGEICQNDPTSDRILWIEYSAPTLKYIIMLHLDAEAVGISGDVSHPFGGDSMYEICVPCSSISGGPDGYHPGQICLSFYHGDPENQSNRQMTIMKTETGELKVWPAYPFPQGHKYGPQKVSSSETTE